MAVLDDLLQKVSDPVLRDRLTKEIHKATKHKKFGLVFEEHLPECTPLYDVPIKKGSRVAVRDTEIKETFTVLSVEDGTVKCVSNNDKSLHEFPLNDLVTVAEFGDPIYPYLQTIDTVCNAPDSDLWHTLIEADNYHALQLLEYMYAGKVDCIYIDPPYNTGARDWKYNNNYVDSNDLYRHSKWLSFMVRRLKVAKRLLNPKTGIMILAIDDNELNQLGLLLDDVFCGYKKFCISVVHNPNGNQGNNIGVTNEFLYFLLPSNDQLLSLEDRTDDPDIRPLRDVSGNSNLRTDAKNCFYPIYVKDGRVIGFGDVCEDSFHPGTANVMRDDDILEVYPIDVKGTEKKWVFARQTVESIVDELQVEWNDSRKIWDIIRYKTKFTYKSVWTKKSYNANSYGSKLLNKILSEKKFDYPKSVYAVMECIKAACGNKKNALIVDYFAGSGTTLHAVNLLNAEDNGKRRCIMITNNEVSEKEGKALSKKGFRPGDDIWENLGIARHVAWPRSVCSIKGIDAEGNPLKGEYCVYHDEYVSDTHGRYKKIKVPDDPALKGLKMSDGFKANAIYFKLGFLDKNAVALGRQFKELLGVLWMKAGAIGPCPYLAKNATIPDMMILPKNKMAILVDDTAFASFAEQIKQHAEIETIYLVTDSDRGYREMSREIGVKNTYQLYRDYLDNFRINHRR